MSDRPVMYVPSTTRGTKADLHHIACNPLSVNLYSQMTGGGGEVRSSGTVNPALPIGRTVADRACCASCSGSSRGRARRLL